jgi:DNA polymerase III subunit beta
MKLLKLNRETILKPLQSVTGIVERRHTLPILSNVLLEIKDESLTIVATDLEIQVSATSAISKAKEYSVTVSAKKLLDILRTLPENETITLENVDSRLKVSSGSSRFNLQTLPAEDFPRLAEPQSISAKISLKQKELKKLLALVQFSMAQQDIRYYLNGLLFLVEGSLITAVATDGHRLSLASLGMTQAHERVEVILPRKAVQEMVKLLTDNDESVEIELLHSQVKVSFSNVTLVSKIVDGKFPDYKKVVPTTYVKTFDIDRLRLLQALQRAAILSNEKFRGVRWILAPGMLTVVCSNSEQEEAREELPVEYNGEAIDIGFNITYLLDVLNNVESEKVTCAFGDANSSTLVTIPNSPDFKYVVMPMRI